jgi:predicted transcriptional regulator
MKYTNLDVVLGLLGFKKLNKTQAVKELNEAHPELTQSQLAKRLGVSRQLVSQVFKLHGLEVAKDQSVETREMSSGGLPE